MNMKKTIAALAAGAVAVSAMATTVSALEAKTLTYNLVKNEKQNDASGTITTTIPNVVLQAGGQVVIDAENAHNWDSVITITGSYYDDGAGSTKYIPTIVATGRNWETGWSKEGQDLMWDAGTSSTGNKVTIPVTAASDSNKYTLKESSQANITVTVKYYNLPSSVNYVGALNGLINSGDRGINVKVYGTTGGTPAEEGSAAVAAKIVSKTAGAAIRDESVLNAKIGEAGKKVSLTYVDGSAIDTAIGAATKFADSGNSNAATKVTLVTADQNALSGWYVGNVSSTAAAAAIDAATWSTAAGDAMTAAAASTAAKNAAAAVLGTKVDINEYSIYGATTTDGEWIDVTAGKDATTGTPAVPGIPDLTTPAYQWTGLGAATEVGANTVVGIPFRTTRTSTAANPYAESSEGAYTKNEGNVLTHIWTTDDESSLVNTAAVRAVINDAVVNYSDVTFVFNTATKNVKVKYAADGTVDTWQYTTDDAKVRYNDNGAYWEIIDYKQFGRHWYTNDPGYDANTIYIGQDWLGNNLFEGALVINSGLTLSLRDTDKFDWTGTSLSFSWDAIQDSALTNNAFANYIQTMVLRTSADWYWDNFQVVLGATEAEEVDTTSPIEGEDEDLPEEDADLGDETEDEPEEEPEDEPEEEPEVAPIAESPKTGNAPVALAVIPVALAAAAVVAKKRG